MLGDIYNCADHYITFETEHICKQGTVTLDTHSHRDRKVLNNITVYHSIYY